MGVGVVVMLCLIALVSANALDAYEVNYFVIIIIVELFILVCDLNIELKGAFVQFIKDFNRNYNEATYTKRFEV